jgi:hypothetical protein
MRKTAAVLPGLLLAAAVAGPALAAKPSPPPKQEPLALEAVALPVIVDGKLINYVFCSISLNLYPSVDATKVQDKAQYFRDDLVRVGHRTPFTRKDDYTKIDETKVQAEIMRFAPTVVGPGVVKSATVTRQVSQKLFTLPPAPQTKSREIIP